MSRKKKIVAQALVIAALPFLINAVIAAPDVPAPNAAIPNVSAPTAPEAAGAAKAQSEKLDSACVDGLKPYLLKKQLDFAGFMDTHFRSEKPTSELIPAAVKKYAEMRKDGRAWI
ncbi:hypothetical protein HYV58_01405, partial [Candidatus Peregrinibacteria bacterium]|nr:hypothetical protein [Candidatus Peregrinibacteria bacterium]